MTSPWMTRKEAAAYLRWSVRTVDRHLVRMQHERVYGKMRIELQEAGLIKKVRILARDVYAICPLPPSEQAEHLISSQ